MFKDSPIAVYVNFLFFPLIHVFKDVTITETGVGYTHIILTTGNFHMLYGVERKVAILYTSMQTNKAYTLSHKHHSKSLL